MAKEEKRTRRAPPLCCQSVLGGLPSASDAFSSLTLTLTKVPFFLSLSDVTPLYMDYQHDICGKFRIDPYYKDFFVCLVEWHLHSDLIFGIQPEGDV